MSTVAPSEQRSRYGRLSAVVVACAVVALAIAAGATLAVAQSVSDQRAEVERIQAEVAAIDGEVGAAAEAYNGARYRVGEIETRIESTTRTLNGTEVELAQARVTLGRRLAALYATPEPSLAEMVLTSATLTQAGDRLRVLEEVADQDARVITGVRQFRKRLGQARAQLETDRVSAKQEVERARAEQARIEDLLRQRSAVLDQAKGELAQALEAERERQRREAARLAEVAAAAALAESAVDVTAPPAAQPEGGSSAPAAAVPSGEGNARVVAIAYQYLGVPYVWGGASPSGFDCSGLASYCYAQIGKSVPHYTGAIWEAFPRVPNDQLQPGDLVFFRADLGHMGIYVGGGNYINAPQTGDVVKVSSLANRSDFQGAVRP